MKPEKEVHQTH